MKSSAKDGTSRFGFYRSKPSEPVSTSGPSKTNSSRNPPKPLALSKPVPAASKQVSAGSKPVSVLSSSVPSSQQPPPSSSYSSRFGFSRSRSTLNNNTGGTSKQKNDAENGGIEKDGRKEKEEGKEKDNKILTIQSLQQSPKPIQKFSPKFGKRFSPKFSRQEKKSGSPVREYKRGGLVPRPYKPLTDHYISKPTLSLTAYAGFKYKFNLKKESSSSSSINSVIENSSQDGGREPKNPGMDVRNQEPVSNRFGGTYSKGPASRTTPLSFGSTSSRFTSTVSDSHKIEVGIKSDASMRSETISTGNKGLPNREDFSSKPTEVPLGTKRAFASRLGSSSLNFNRSAVSDKPDISGLRASFFSRDTSRTGSWSRSSAQSREEMEKRAGEGSRADGISTTEGMSTGDGMSRVGGMNAGGMISTDKQKPLNPEPETRNFRMRQQFTQSRESSQGSAIYESTSVQDKTINHQENQNNATYEIGKDTLAMISGLSQLGQGTAGMRSWTRQQAAPRFGTSSVEGGTTDSDFTISAVVSDIRTRTGSDQGSGNLRKWTKSLAPAQQIPTPSNLSEERDASISRLGENRPSALDCLNKLKLSTKSVLDHHRTGIRTNPKVSKRSSVLPDIPQENSFCEDPTNPSANQAHKELEEITEEKMDREKISEYDLDLDCELVIIDTDEEVFKVPQKIEKPRVVRTKMIPERKEPVLTERTEKSPNETESDSGFFTSSHSKYSLESLQEERISDKEEQKEGTENIQMPEVELRNGSKRGGSQPPKPPKYYQASVKLSTSLPTSFTSSRGEKSRSGFLSLSDHQTNRDMTTSTNTFSDVDEMCSSRETSPLELLDELFKKTDKDERKAISPGLVKENRQIFERKSQDNINKLIGKSAKITEKYKEQSSMEKLRTIMQSEQVPTKPVTSLLSPDETDSSLTGVSKSSTKQSFQDMTASITNSISMCSSYTEGSAGEVQEKTTTSKTTSSPSTYSDNEKDFLIDDDYKDQPQLTFYDQEDSIEESIFSTLDSLLAGNRVENQDVKPVETEKVSELRTRSPRKTSFDVNQGSRKNSLPGSPIRPVSAAGPNLRRFSLTNHVKEQLERAYEDTDGARLRSRADTLSSLASDDCILDFECRLSDDEDGEQKMVNKERSLSPRIREVSRNFEDMGRVEEKERSRRVEDGRGGGGGGSDKYSEYRPSLSRSSSTVSDEGIIIDRSTHNSITQDTLEIKLLLLKLRRILQETDDDGGLPSNLLETLALQDVEDNSLREENLVLRKQVLQLKQQVEEKDRKLKSLNRLLPSNSANTNNNQTRNAAIQTDRQRPVSCGSVAQDGLIRFDDLYNCTKQLQD
ncbi:uncharacterized protein LOC111708998 isoform X10 [Eurytemora carolleeae]|uniref:uncharacterized protein LOC111708998 isoform X10 n=1 Tax=Eurytemora carolleeae TaxID=1294199 RepID=UPI000C7730CD|nr:uncharacterized protein LOC111708998 isoform X10 [Eurytemora carolleeae]XP_023338322.1 uncharacterized protein LOC111708998 isoform X10 [Eurytemora carolleeae]|eukprot:XP_023338321.1 uncharacterized protein LOC111708998 isoform X10 [Eurytemora affinis]